ncbi:hypothetical protein PYW08_010517 [Mythimna loreyi]|uniref:Uncharacterized protein n=1 Tax=Mythimna loreyi TaxID=667449 RepID=A0ACC2Q4Z9_9NEOP|nr:hypothetical protein PYW08_010517 [Mythimna loreyi]
MWKTRVLMIFVLLVGLAQSFDWDIVVGNGNQLIFYYNGIQTHTENIPLADDITSVAYDPVGYRVLVAFEDKNTGNMSISSLDLSTMKIQPLVNRKANDFFPRAVYDPVTELLFWKENTEIYSISSSSASSVAVDGNLVLKTQNNCHDIVVDSCGGYIYWITDYEIERARLNGSEREVLINSVINHRGSLAIDQQTQTLYWTETILNHTPSSVVLTIESADFNGKNRKTVHLIKDDNIASSLTVSKDYIYWGNHLQNTISQLPKNPQGQTNAKEFAKLPGSSSFRQRIAANYTVSEQTRKVKSCQALKNLQPSATEPESTDESLFFVNGSKVSGESRCECTQGYISERCGVSICQNYCLQGICTVSAEGKPTCRCEDNYSGTRCEVNACQDYCLNGGTCSLNEEDEPVCECSEHYEGKRCDVPASLTKCIQTVSMLKSVLNADIMAVSSETAVQFTCTSTVV